MPRTWVHRKSDLKNIKSIHKKFGQRPLKTFPQVSTLAHVWGMYVRGYKVIKPLNLIDYNKTLAKQRLKDELAWKDYGGKHYESMFTKFYQAHILPSKFGIDKRKAHLSTLICSGQISREQALLELAQPLYDSLELENDTDYVCKKLDFSRDWMRKYLESPGQDHAPYGTDEQIFKLLQWGQKFLGKL